MKIKKKKPPLNHFFFPYMSVHFGFTPFSIWYRLTCGLLLTPIPAEPYPWIILTICLCCHGLLNTTDLTPLIHSTTN